MAPTQLPEAEVHALMRAEHGDPFGVLGPHETARGLVVRALLPGAQGVTVLTCHAFAMRLVGARLQDRTDDQGDDYFKQVLRDALALLKGEGLPPEEADELSRTAAQLSVQPERALQGSTNPDV